MSRTTIQPDGRITYRTALFQSLSKAQSFARCVQANAVRFERALVHASTTSKIPKWFVSFEPKSESRKDALHAGQHEARKLRAAAQEFIFWPDPAVANLYWCFSVSSGETYEVTHGGCSCHDYLYRCQNAGLQCKHMLAWSAQRAAGILGKTDKVTNAPRISREELLRRMDDDFGPSGDKHEEGLSRSAHPESPNKSEQGKPTSHSGSILPERNTAMTWTLDTRIDVTPLGRSACRLENTDLSPNVLPAGTLVADFATWRGFSMSESHAFPDATGLVTQLPNLRAKAQKRRRDLVISSLDEAGLRLEVARIPYVPKRRH